MTSPQSDADAIRAWLDEKGALASEATEGPWRDDESGIAHFHMVDAVMGTIAHGTWPQDAAFIADARTSLPAALAMVRVLMEACVEMSYWKASKDALARVRRIAEGA